MSRTRGALEGLSIGMALLACIGLLVLTIALICILVGSGGATAFVTCGALLLLGTCTAVGAIRGDQ